MNFPQSMYVEQYNYAARRLLQAGAPPPPLSSNGTNSPPTSSSNSSSSDLDPNNSLNMNSHFSPSMAIILVVLLSAFFFMGFFSVYVRRCSTEDDLGGEGDNGGGGGGGGNQRQEQVGLDPAMVANLPMVAFNSAAKKKGCTECVVCLSEFEEGEPLRMLPKCKHVFHPDCIDMWLYSHTTCPLCRRSLLASASRSFRWGSSRRASFNDGSVRSGGGSMRGADAQTDGSTAATTPTAAPEIQLVVTESGSRRGDRGEGGPAGGKSDRDRERRLPWLRRSHSTGHALRRAMSRTGLFGGVPATPPAACTAAPLTPPAGLHRSRSVAGTMAGACAEAESSSTAEGRPPRPTAWSSSLKRAISLTRLPVGMPSPPAAAFAAPVGQASRSSSGRRTFERLTT